MRVNERQSRCVFLLFVSMFSSKFNYYTELMNLRDQHGEHLFFTIVLGLVCASCMKTGENCNHKLAMAPDWKPPERTGKVDAIMVCV